MRYAIPQAAITIDPQTQKYGFVVWFAGKRPHYVMVEIFDTQKDALEYLDPHNERVWESPQTDEASIVAVSTRYKEGGAPMRKGMGRVNAQLHRGFLASGIPNLPHLAEHHVQRFFGDFALYTNALAH